MGAVREAALAFVNSDPPDDLLIKPLIVLLPAGDLMSRMEAFVVRMTLASKGEDAGEASRNLMLYELTAAFRGFIEILGDRARHDE
eukprot:6388303-Prymnesium_polylepis.1